MDVKGAYLNGTLKETIYMMQLEGFTSGKRQKAEFFLNSS
jgi:hypothetical protein